MDKVTDSLGGVPLDGVEEVIDSYADPSTNYAPGNFDSPSASSFKGAWIPQSDGYDVVSEKLTSQSALVHTRGASRIDGPSPMQPEPRDEYYARTQY